MIILPINDQETIKEVCDAAKENGEAIFFPSHYAVEKGEIIGAFALETPTANWWMNTEKVRRRQSLQMFDAMEALQADRGNNVYFMPCLESSPYFKLMTSSGKYIKLPEPMFLFVRNIRKECDVT